MNLHEKFLNIGEYYAAGLFEEEDRSMFYRKALALRRYFEHCPLPPYRGKPLYPSGKLGGMAVTPAYCRAGFNINKTKLTDPKLLEALRSVKGHRSFVPPEHTVTGDMYTHSMPNYERILAEGLDSYEKRVQQMKDPDLREGLLHLLAGIRRFHDRCLQYLKEQQAHPGLIDALEQVPFLPARNVEEAIQCWNFVLYLDGVDNLGSLPQGLAPYYKGEEIGPLLENLYDNLNAGSGYSMAAGIVENDVILPALKAVRGKRRPMIELFVDENTSNAVWDEALDCVLSGCTQPAFYNKTLFLEGLRKRFPEIAEEDLKKLCGGGCTEMMIPGLSNVGSVDAGINLVLIFERFLHENLQKFKDFEAFYIALLEEIRTETHRVLEAVAASQKHRAEHAPLPMRTLLTDDCIEREAEFNNGGARYGWSIVIYAGIVNLLDGLMNVKTMVFEEKTLSAAELLHKLNDNDAVFLKKCKESPHRHGIDDPATNAMARRLTRTLFGFMEERKPYLGLGFLPATIMFNDYIRPGKNVGATPCGRRAGEPIADSLTSIFGKDDQGPTAMLKSVTAMALSEAVGTPVVNLTVSPSIGKPILKSLIQTYMKLGGMQLQITCVDRTTLEKAYADPDSYKNLVVRVGGYSDYFVNLNDDLKKKVLERTIH